MNVKFSKEKYGIPVSYVVDLLTEEFPFTKNHFLNIIYSKGESENRSEKINSINKIMDDYSYKSEWIQLVTTLLFYIMGDLKLVHEIIESLEILDSFRSKISGDYEIVTDEFIKDLQDDEITLLTKSIHSVNSLLNDYGGISFAFGQILLLDLKNSEITSFFKKELDYSNYPFSSKYFEFPWSISYRIMYEATYSNSKYSKINLKDITFDSKYYIYESLSEAFNSLEYFNINLQRNLQKRLLISIYNIFFDPNGFNQIHCINSLQLMRENSIVEKGYKDKIWKRLIKNYSFKSIKMADKKLELKDYVSSIPPSTSKNGTFHPPEEIDTNYTFLKLSGFDKNISIQDQRENSLISSINPFLHASLLFKFHKDFFEFSSEIQKKSLLNILNEHEKSKTKYQRMNLINFIMYNYDNQDIGPYLIDNFNEWNDLFSRKSGIFNVNLFEKKNVRIIRSSALNIHKNNEISLKKFKELVKFYIKFMKRVKTNRTKILLIFAKRFLNIFDKYKSKKKLANIINILKDQKEENPFETLFQFSRKIIHHILEQLGIFETISPKESFENWIIFQNCLFRN